jgi:hypothetical protein
VSDLDDLSDAEVEWLALWGHLAERHHVEWSTATPLERLRESHFAQHEEADADHEHRSEEPLKLDGG